MGLGLGLGFDFIVGFGHLGFESRDRVPLFGEGGVEISSYVSQPLHLRKLVSAILLTLSTNAFIVLDLFPLAYVGLVQVVDLLSESCQLKELLVAFHV